MKRDRRGGKMECCVILKNGKEMIFLLIFLVLMGPRWTLASLQNSWIMLEWTAMTFTAVLKKWKEL